MLLPAGRDGELALVRDRRGTQLRLVPSGSDAAASTSSYDVPLVQAPDDEKGLAASVDALPSAGLVAIAGDDELTKVLLSEEARWGRGLTVVLVGSYDTDAAETLLLSGARRRGGPGCRARGREMTDVGLGPRREGVLGSLFEPRGVVVIGASTDPDKLGGAMAASLAGLGLPVALVNSRGGGGMFTSVREAADGSPVPLDLAVLCVPAAACAAVLEECADAGVGAALICAGGFAEAGGDGLEHERRLREAASSTGIRLLGPNTSGFFVPASGLRASFVPGVAHLTAGSVAVVAASGGLNHALAFALERQDVGVSLGVGIGAGIDVTAVDVLEHLARRRPHDGDRPAHRDRQRRTGVARGRREGLCHQARRGAGGGRARHR